jgi:hypothetical protein
MKTLSPNSRYIFRSITIVAFFVFFVFACSKNNDNPSSKAVKFCGSVDWTSTLGQSGYFKGALTNSTFGLTSVKLNNTTLVFNRDASGHLMNDNLGNTFTYDKDNLVKIVTGTATGLITFTFDTNSHLTQTHVQNQDDNGSTELTLNYTYDTNGDPVKITGLGVLISSSGTTTSNYDITADYLTSKDSFLPLLPELAPFTPEFAYSWFLSTHLINKWLIKITTTTGGQVNTSNITQQYTYKYNTDGKVATMWHSSNNIYTFTYSGCN